MPVESVDNGAKIHLQHAKGASVEILLYGATILSWKSYGSNDGDEPSEKLFVSSKALLDGSKAVRGGIPVVFPFFGAPTRPEHSKLSQHGYARTSYWKWDGSIVMDNEAGVAIRLTYTPTSEQSQDPVTLAYVVTLAEHQLSTDLHVTNTSTSTEFPPSPIHFQALLHTYLRAPASSVHISGLNGLYYTDKTQDGTPRQQETRRVVDVLNYTDAVYEDGPRSYEVTWPGGGIHVKAIGFKDIVVWNPSKEAGIKLADMEEGGWEKYVCVEPGYVTEFKPLNPGETWIGGQTLSVIQEPRRL